MPLVIGEVGSGVTIVITSETPASDISSTGMGLLKLFSMGVDVERERESDRERQRQRR